SPHSRSISSGAPKPLSTTSAPSAARARAMARPMPEVDPVTRARLPCRNILDSVRWDWQEPKRVRRTRSSDLFACAQSGGPMRLNPFDPSRIRVEDQRGGRFPGGGGGKLGCGAIVIALIGALVFGVDPGQMLGT